MNAANTISSCLKYPGAVSPRRLQCKLTVLEYPYKFTQITLEYVSIPHSTIYRSDEERYGIRSTEHILWYREYQEKNILLWWGLFQHEWVRQQSYNFFLSFIYILYLLYLIINNNNNNLVTLINSWSNYNNNPLFGVVFGYHRFILVLLWERCWIYIPSLSMASTIVRWLANSFGLNWMI